MKHVLLLTALLASASLSAVTFSLGESGKPASVSVDQGGRELRITCRFTPQTNFDEAINEELNNETAQDLCRKGLLLYWKVPQGKSAVLSGIHFAGPVKNAGKEIEYSFGAPAVKPVMHDNPPAVKPAPAKDSITESKPAPAPAAVPAEKVKKDQPVQKSVVCKNNEKLTVIRYQQKNGVVSVNETRVYQPAEFVSQEEFDKFCNEMFAQISKQNKQNFDDVLKHVKSMQK